MKERNGQKPKSNWTLPLVITVTGVIVTFLGVVSTIYIGLLQLYSTENIAMNENKIKMWELFSKDFLNIDYTKEVWETEGSIRKLGAILNDTTQEDKSLQKIARDIFEECITTTISQFHRTEEIRINAGRVIASMYHIDKKYVIRRLVDEIKPEDYPGYFFINGAVVVALAKIPDYWEGTLEQYKMVEKLKYHKYLGEKEKTTEYRNGWLINEALKKWKQKK